MSLNLLIGILLTFIGQVIVWFQFNAQFQWTWAKENFLILSLMLALPGTILLIYGSRYMYMAIQSLWSLKLIGFSIGMFSYYIMVKIFSNEEITSKTGICLFLAIAIIAIQVFWK